MATPPARLNPPDEGSVLKQLERIEASESFRHALRHREILRWLVLATLGSRAQSIKETSIAVEVLGRAAGYDPQADPVGRVEANRVRAKLEAYYGSAGPSDLVRIRIRKGQYVPEFSWFSRPEAGDQQAGPTHNGGPDGRTELLNQHRGPGVGTEDLTQRATDTARRLHQAIATAYLHLLNASSQFFQDFLSLCTHPFQLAGDLNGHPDVTSHRFVRFVIGSCFLSAVVSAAVMAMYSTFRLYPDTLVLAAFYLLFACLFALSWKLVAPSARIRLLFAIALVFVNTQALCLGITFLFGGLIVWAFGSVLTPHPGLPLVMDVMDGLADCSVATGLSLRSCLVRPGQIVRFLPGDLRDITIDRAFIVGSGIVITGFLFAAFIQFLSFGISKRITGTSWIRTILAYVSFGACAGIFTFVLLRSEERSETANCQIWIPSSPTFNPGPLQFGDYTFCSDPPLLSVRNTTSGTHGPASQEEQSLGIYARRGDIIRVRLWINNGAAEGNQERNDQNTARDVRVSVRIWGESQESHRINARVEASNAPSIDSRASPYGGDTFIHTPSGLLVRYVEGSTVLCVYPNEARLRAVFPAYDMRLGNWRIPPGRGMCGPDLSEIPIPDGITQEGVGIGLVRPGYRHAVFVCADLWVK